MKRIIYFLLLFPLILNAFQRAFFEDEDPSLYYHVNVINGQLNLGFEDGVVQAPVPIPITRTYSSSGALDFDPSIDKSDLYLKRASHTEWMFVGGWSFLPQCYLLLQTDPSCQRDPGRGTIRNTMEEGNFPYYPRCFRAYVAEPSGRMMAYECFKHEHSDIWLKPKTAKSKNFGELSSRKNPQNNQLKIGRGKATLYLPDGGKRIYKGECSEFYPEECCRLELEILPNKHRIEYFYDEGRLARIEMRNPSGDKIFASIYFSEKEFGSKKTLSLQTSEGQEINYKMREFKERTYLEAVQNTWQPSQKYDYQPGRKQIGGRLNVASFGNQERMRVEYYLPKNKDKENKWAKRPRKIPSRGDKVKNVQFREPATGDFVSYAHFYYEENQTDAWDAEGIKTSYHHDGHNLKSIEYFDERGEKFSVVRFEYNEGLLQSKSLEDAKGVAHFSKSFRYDKERNIIEEVFRDLRTNAPPLIKKFTYYSDTYLLKTEEQEGGVTTHFTYLDQTDLVASKLLSAQGEIFYREYYFYDQDHILSCKIVDDGSAVSYDNLAGVTERQIERYSSDPKTGLCIEKKCLYLDLKTHQELPLFTYQYTYNQKNQISLETICKANGDEAYTILYDYDLFGNLTRKTTPIGRCHLYGYDELGRLVSSKEPKRPTKTFAYDHANHPAICQEGDKISYSHYNRKGQLVEQIDKNGNSTKQVYDCFGRSIQTLFPKALDETSTPYTPTISSTYDLQGNLISTTNSKNETTYTTYNPLRKPILTQLPDGSTFENIYNADGTLSCAIDEENNEIAYTYDFLKRPLTKTIFDSDKTLLSHEKWTYSTFHLQTYQNPQGLITTYTYDGAGRKMSETSGERAVTYDYDHLGHVKKIHRPDITYVTLRNNEGEVIEQWEEDCLGRIENHMWFYYDQEGRKIRAHRMTSKGIAKDFFHYDDEGRLIEHTDPHNETTRISYTQILDTFGQKVEQKTEINALGHRTIETSDAQGRLHLIEKQDADQQTVAKEEIVYDRAGNKAKRISTVYHHNQPIRTHTTQWIYNERGWPTQEIEEESKVTTFTYDRKGRLVEKIYPNKISLYQSYDGLGRLLEVKTSDGTIHYSYTYDTHPDPVLAEDNSNHSAWARKYNAYCELISESRPDGTILTWEYDNLGRCINFTLPDHSSIQYSYQGMHLHTIHRLSSQGDRKYTHTYSEFDPNGQVQKEELIHHLGVVKTHHDLLERPEQRQTPWYSLQLDYGPTHLVMRQHNTLFAPKSYTYDPLDQLNEEGSLRYDFDSLGNPQDCVINPLNQILTKPGHRFNYNPNGDLIAQYSQDGQILYQYDSLGRLTDIEYSAQSHIKYTYDPFSRLYTKTAYENENTFWSRPNTWSVKTIYFLYDKSNEIGTYKEPSTLLELKVNGLGRPHDIGGAIALELGSKTYLPLHDFNGHMIALIDDKGKLIEKWDPDAFGKNTLTTSSLSPWRFSSKRTEEHLIFFGLRFYDPQLGRWLSPDPAGAFDSPNLYLYVRNSPLSRLDLFGLWSDNFTSTVHLDQMDKNIDHIYYGKIHYHEHSVDVMIYSQEIANLKFTPEEMQKGTFDIFDHLQDVAPNEGTCIGIVSFVNGINVQTDQFRESVRQTISSIPGTPLILGFHNESRGLAKDVSRTFSEVNSRENKDTTMLGQFFSAILNGLDKVNHDALYLHIAHSRGGATSACALAHLPAADKELVKNKLLFVGVAPANAPRNSHVKEAVSFYSELDPVTKRFGEDLQYELVFDGKTVNRVRSNDYNIQFIPASIQWYEVSKRMDEHSYLGETCQRGLESSIIELDTRYGFYGNKK